MKSLILFFAGVCCACVFQQTGSVQNAERDACKHVGGQNQCAQAISYAEECTGCPSDECKIIGTVCRKAIKSSKNRCKPSPPIAGHLYDCVWESGQGDCGSTSIGEINGGKCGLSACSMAGDKCGEEIGKTTVKECTIKKNLTYVPTEAL
jgi:hypothetical protein